LLTLAGCASSGALPCAGPIADPPGVSPESFPPYERGKGLPPYRQLRMIDAQCLAARTSVLANLLDVEAETLLREASAGKRAHEPASCSSALLSQVLSCLALGDRNRSAAKALDAFFRLAEAEAAWDRVGAMSAQVKGALDKARAIKEKGVETPLDDTALER